MKKKKAKLLTNRLVLKSYDDGDKDKMVALLCNEEIKKTFMIPDFENKEQAEHLFERLKEFSRSEENFEYGICHHCLYYGIDSKGLNGGI